MSLIGWVQILLYVALILLLTRSLGGFLACVVSGERNLLSPVLAPVERGLYRAAGVDPRAEQHWLTYAVAMLLFNAAGLVLLYALQRLQADLLLNPQSQPATGSHRFDAAHGLHGFRIMPLGFRPARCRRLVREGRSGRRVQGAPRPSHGGTKARETPKADVPVGKPGVSPLSAPPTRVVPRDRCDRERGADR
jgi:hypothetical protein